LDVTFSRMSILLNVTSKATMKFIAYYRVSTKMQGRSGLGLEAQQHAVGQHLKSCDETLMDDYMEVESGKNNARPKLEAALKRCRLTGATLIIAKLDRLSRNAAFLFNLRESKVKFVCADMPEANDLTIGVLSLLAQHEAEQISARTKAALAAAKARGVKLGNIATLTNHDTTKAREAHVSKAADRNAEMREVLEELKREYGSNVSLRFLSTKLNEAGYKTARGKDWRATSVNRRGCKSFCVTAHFKHEELTAPQTQS